MLSLCLYTLCFKMMNDTNLDTAMVLHSWGKKYFRPCLLYPWCRYQQLWERMKLWWKEMILWLLGNFVYLVQVCNILSPLYLTSSPSLHQLLPVMQYIDCSKIVKKIVLSFKKDLQSESKGYSPWSKMSVRQKACKTVGPRDQRPVKPKALKNYPLLNSNMLVHGLITLLSYCSTMQMKFQRVLV